MSWENNYLHFKNSSALDSVKANEKRQQSFDKFVASGLPSRKDEAWKYTSLTDFKSIEWKATEDSNQHLTHEQMQEVSKNLPSDFINFVFVNGILNQTLSDDFDSLIAVGELEENDFICDESNVEGRLLNLAQSFLNKKITLSVSKGKVIEKPIQVVFVQSSKNSVYLSEKLNINLAENSEIKLLIHSMSFVNSTADAMNLNVNINVENSARLTFVQLQNEDTSSFHFSQCNLNLAANAQVTTLALTLGNKLTRNYYQLNFNAEHASAAVYGLGVIDSEQHMDNYTFIRHAIGHNQSVQHYKSILSGSSHSVFRGRVMIEPNAQKANSEQLNNNLLLTRTAQADSIPQLEIFADDVKAGHGSTVGQLSKEEMFYFLSRGINQFEAVRMLSYGFAKELVLKIENQYLQSFLISALNQKLERMVQNG